jgi:hypothetical protein
VIFKDNNIKFGALKMEWCQYVKENKSLIFKNINTQAVTLQMKGYHFVKQNK